MGIFNRIFSSAESSAKHEQKLDWIPLQDNAHLDEIKRISADKRVLIFKHSTRCGISSMVLRKFEAAYQPEEDTVLYFLDLINHRDISNNIAEQFQVQHESPQLLVIKKGICDRHASHHQILELVGQ